MKAFDGFFEGMPAQVVYLCSQGKLLKGMYIFDRSSFKEAVVTYASLKSQLVRTYGQPSYDAASKDARDRMSTLGVEQSEKDRYYSSWDKHDLVVLLSIIGPGGGWRAAIVVEEPRPAPVRGN
jgi:hypothetical protein